MATNKLFEAAAEILAAGKGKNAMPPQKLEGEVQVAGGPTPENAKPDDDSHKMTFAAKSAAAPTTKPSAASAKTEEVETEEEVVAEEHLEEKMAWKKKMKEDVDALFSDDETISEEFKVKVSTIFEARVQDRVTQLEEQIEAQYASMLEEAVESVKQELTEKINDYVGYIVEEWMEENQIAIEKGIRAELTEDFINGLRNLFAEHYIDVPAEKVDLVDELATKVDELEAKLDEEVERSVEYRTALIEAYKEVVTHEVCEGLVATQVAKIRELAESVDFSTEEEYRQKLEIIRENYFPSGVKKADAAQLNEQVDSDEKVDVTDPIMKSIDQSISKTTRI